MTKRTWESFRDWSKAQRVVLVCAETVPPRFRRELSGGHVVRFEVKAKDSSVNLRLPRELLEAVRGRAKLAGIPYQRFIRMALERALQDPK